MKNISFLLGVIILVLALKPCSDGLNTEHETNDEMTTHHEHQNDRDDSCAMLCVCNCCGTLIVYHEPATFNVRSKLSIPSKLYTYYGVKYQFETLFNIWQPPQFV